MEETLLEKSSEGDSELCKPQSFIQSEEEESNKSEPDIEDSLKSVKDDDEVIITSSMVEQESDPN